MPRMRVNTEPLREWIKRFASPGAHLAGAEDAGIEHVRLTNEVFENQGAPLASWAPKVIPTDEDGNFTAPKGSPARKTDPTPRLQDLNGLRNSINFAPTQKGYDIGPGPLPYAAVHQFGATIAVSPGMRRVLRGLGFRPKRSTTSIVIPARPYLGIADEWFEILGLAYLSGRVTAATGGSA